MFAYVKMMDEFSTTYVRSISRFGYCLSTLEIALERITQTSLADLVALQQRENVGQRNKQFVRNMRESFRNATHRGGSLYVEGEAVREMLDKVRRPSETNFSQLEGVSMIKSRRSPRLSLSKPGGRLTSMVLAENYDEPARNATNKPSTLTRFITKRLGGGTKPGASKLMSLVEGRGTRRT